MTDLYIRFADEAESLPLLYNFVDAFQTVRVPLDPPVEHQTWVYLLPADEECSLAEREHISYSPLTEEEIATDEDYAGAVFLRNETYLQTEKYVNEPYLKKQPKYACMDVIGTFYNVDNTDPENPIVTPIPGWCVNVRTLDGEDGTPLEPYRVDPEPAMWRRVWL